MAGVGPAGLQELLTRWPQDGGHRGPRCKWRPRGSEDTCCVVPWPPGFPDACRRFENDGP